MKTISIILLLLLTYACKAQVNIKTITGYYVESTYYKDIDNTLNDFTGTYIYNSGTTQLKFVLQKKLAVPSMSDGINYTRDLVVGEYQYIDHGVEKSNTLINLNFNNSGSYGISGNNLLSGNIRGCDDCLPSEFRLEVWAVDASTHTHAQIILRKKIINGQAALEANIYWQVRSKTDDETLLPTPLPGGVFILLKQ